MAQRNIICFEAEWLYSESHKEDGNCYNLKTEPLLNWLKEYYNCDVIHRYVLFRSNLEYYLRQFSDKRKYNRYDIVYFACHGCSRAISLEDDPNNDEENNGIINFDDLVDIGNGFFKNKILHFSSCKTLLNTSDVAKFKKDVGAWLVCGYTKEVDAMKSSIADIALFNEFMNLKDVTRITNRETSRFWKTYGSLLDELGFKVI